MHVPARFSSAEISHVARSWLVCNLSHGLVDDIIYTPAAWDLGLSSSVVRTSAVFLGYIRGA